MNKKADIDVVRRQNRYLILQALRSHGPRPRVEIGRLTQLSPATVTAITAQLIAEGLVLEKLGDAIAHASRGRPTVDLQLNPQALHVLALKISIDRFELALSDYSGRRVADKVLALSTFNLEAKAVAAKASQFILAFLADLKIETRDVKILGIAVQGAVDSSTGVLAWSPAFKARNIALAEPIAAHTGIDCVLANDANMIAEGLMAQEHHLYRGTAAVVFLGYGVGLGLVINGTTFHGSNGAAAEFGHMNHEPSGALCRCGRLGCLEAYASDYGILRHAEGLPLNIAPPYGAVDRSVMLALENAARRGDMNALAAFQAAGRALGFGLARLVALLNPDRIVIAGPGSSAFELMETAMNQALEDGVVEALRQNLKIERLPIDTDMILTGTFDKILGELDLGYRN
jgi:predicted NBD/HSP70 family sugar kinase